MKKEGMKFIKFLDSISYKDIPLVGGKNASLGEMIRHLKQHNILVPFGFAITSDAYKLFLKNNNLEKPIKNLLKKSNIAEIGLSLRNLIEKSIIPKDVQKEISLSYKKLSSYYHTKNVDVAIRSSATAEDLPSFSFAGQLESFLNIQKEQNILKYCKKCYSSLFTDRVIAYIKENKLDHTKIYLSVGIQKMVRSDKAGSGVIFTLDTESGFPNIIEITAGYGLGENIVQGKITPDEYRIFKPFLNKKYPILEKKIGKKEKKLIYCKKKFVKNISTTKKEQNSFVLNDQEILKLAKSADILEKHYKKPLDIEWAKDGISKKLYIVQARPETIHSKKSSLFVNYKLLENAKPFLQGIAIGQKITSGKVQIIKSPKNMHKFIPGSILVTPNTTPDWVPIMKKAKAILTDHGGRTSHAAIVSRELNIPAIVGTKNGTAILKEGQEITVNCSSGLQGYAYKGYLQYKSIKEKIPSLPSLKTKIFINIASSEAAYKWWRLPIQGIGLARMEFIINNIIKIHPMALCNFHKIKDVKTRTTILDLTKGFRRKKDYFLSKLSQSICKIASSQYPNPVIVRLSDFKSNEYKELIGGKYFEDLEENPMIGFRGASRYYHKKYKEAFLLECESIKKAQNRGFTNIIIMVPFCRTVKEADHVLNILSKMGLKKTKTYMMAEIPSNIFLAEEFAKKFDGFSIGSNDLTQLILGIDRDSETLKDLFDPKNAAVKIAISDLIKKAHKHNIPVGICGQAPSDFPSFAKFLIDKKIDSISLNPDSVIKTIKLLKK